MTGLLLKGLVGLFLVIPPGVSVTPRERAQLESGGIVAKMSGQSTQRGVLAVGLINASPEAVWSVLTDYENYPRIFNGIKSLETVKSSLNYREHKVVVDSPWPLPDKWTLNAIQLSPDKRKISFHKLGGEFKTFSGEWRLVPQGKSTLLVYKVQIDPGIPLIPEWLINTATKSVLPGIIKSVRQHAK